MLHTARELEEQLVRQAQRLAAPTPRLEAHAALGTTLFFMGEYASMLVVAGLATSLWLGGWTPPFPVIPFTWVPGAIWFLAKLMFIILVYVWLRATLPRVRHDQLMALGWKVLVPLGLLNLVVTAVIVVLRT